MESGTFLNFAIKMWKKKLSKKQRSALKLIFMNGMIIYFNYYDIHREEWVSKMREKICGFVVRVKRGKQNNSDEVMVWIHFNPFDWMISYLPYSPLKLICCFLLLNICFWRDWSSFVAVNIPMIYQWLYLVIQIPR